MELNLGQVLMWALSLQMAGCVVAYFLNRPRLAVISYALLAATVAASCTALIIPPPAGNLSALIVAGIVGYCGYYLTVSSMKK